MVDNMEWFNVFGLIFIAVIMIPNVVFAIKCKDGFDNKWNNKYGQKIIDIRSTARYNIVNPIRKPSDHCYEAES